MYCVYIYIYTHVYIFFFGLGFTYNDLNTSPDIPRWFLHPKYIQKKYAEVSYLSVLQWRCRGVSLAHLRSTTDLPTFGWRSVGKVKLHFAVCNMDKINNSLNFINTAIETLDSFYIHRSRIPSHRHLSILSLRAACLGHHCRMGRTWPWWLLQLRFCFKHFTPHAVSKSILNCVKLVAFVEKTQRTNAFQSHCLLQQCF